MIVIGIDYSITSPSICVHKGPSWSFKNCEFYFLTTKKKYEGDWHNIHGSLHPDWLLDQERYNNISDWALNIITPTLKQNPTIYIEGYAYAAKGVVFNIAENTEVLKHRLWKMSVVPNVIQPSAVKKYASGKGNSNKIGMSEAFIKEVNLKLHNIIGCKEGDSPASDIVDSYYIAKNAFFNHKP